MTADVTVDTVPVVQLPIEQESTPVELSPKAVPRLRSRSLTKLYNALAVVIELI